MVTHWLLLELPELLSIYVQENILPKCLFFFFEDAVPITFFICNTFLKFDQKLYFIVNDAEEF